MKAWVTGWALPLLLARRELRTGMAGFHVFVTCLALGVALIAAIGSLSRSIERALADNARTILGGDLELRNVMIPINQETLARIRELTGSSMSGEIVRLRTIASANERNRLVELKAIDENWPLVGQVQLIPPIEWKTQLDRSDGPGVLASRELLTGFALKIGDRLQLGKSSFTIRAELVGEPDRLSDNLGFGPRVLISQKAAKQAGLLTKGALRYHHYRFRLDESTGLNQVIKALQNNFPDASWRLRTSANATPSLSRAISRTEQFLNLVGLMALAIGGIGVANATRAHLASRITNIAILRAIGGKWELITRIYLLQILALSAIGILLGLILGGFIAAGFIQAGGDLLMPGIETGPWPVPLARAGAFGLLTSLFFSTPALAAISETRPALLFRAGAIETFSGRTRFNLATLLLGIATCALALAIASDPLLTGIVLAGFAFSFVALRTGAILTIRAARSLSRARLGAKLPVPLRLGLANLCHPGAATSTIVASLGLGVATLTAVVTLQTGFLESLDTELPADTPSFFAIDIQPDQGARFDELAHAFGTETPKRRAMLRGRITRLKGIPVNKAPYDSDVAWALRGDRGVTYATRDDLETPPFIGSWWEADYQGETRISLDANLAEGFYLDLGDTITVSVLGRPITGIVTNLRKIDWVSMRMNFTIVMNQTALARAPHTEIATLSLDENKQSAFFAALQRDLPNISLVPVRATIESVRRILDAIALAIQALAITASLIGLLVLCGVVAASQRRRLRESAVLKAIGAARRQILSTMSAEFTILGIVAALIGGGTGILLAFILAKTVFHLEHWRTHLDQAFFIGSLAVLSTLSIGALVCWRTTRHPAGRLLRNE